MPLQPDRGPGSQCLPLPHIVRYGEVRRTPHEKARKKAFVKKQATLYTRQGCHLCDDARELLEKNGLDVTPVDIDAQPELQEKFDTCVPVVEIDGKVRFRGRVDEKLLRRLL